jgi:hypothetical protein
MGNGGQACGQTPCTRQKISSLIYRDGEHLP